MKLNYSHSELVEVLKGEALQRCEGVIKNFAYDTRKITVGENTVYFAFYGKTNDGHDFCNDAYKKGTRCFVVDKNIKLPEDAHVIKVENTLKAFQKWASYHRSKFNIPLIAITGSLGKTTVKEWVYYLMKKEYHITRTPKSFNSQIGVAHSLLLLTEETELAIIEADISHPNEMDALAEMIQPTLGVFTGLGKHYEENFESQKAHLNEHLKLFKGTNFVFTTAEYQSALRRHKLNLKIANLETWKGLIGNHIKFQTNAALAFEISTFFGVEKSVLAQKATLLPTLPGRLEVFEGINNNVIINDTYNIDIDALEQALEYQFTVQKKPENIVVISYHGVSAAQKERIHNLLDRYKPDKVIVLKKGESLPEELYEVKNTSLLFKSSFLSHLSLIVKEFKNRKHETWVEFNLNAIKHNLNYFKSLIAPGTKTLVMVKASSYGTGDTQIPYFLQENSVDYLGVAYADEGATLRENGISLPILVMNSESAAFEDIVKHSLEPSMFSIDNLKEFIAFLEAKGIKNFPIHLKFETGMQRLGILKEEIPNLIKFLKNNDSVLVKSVFSHLADADNSDTNFTENQIHSFRMIKQSLLDSKLDFSKVDFHILNSEGILRFSKQASFDMVRLGIGLFGFTSVNENLKPSLSWKTTIAQIKKIDSGLTVGYGRTFKAEEPMQIATIRVGYADGFRRMLSNGVGGVYINDQYCPVVGNVCMDMTMVDVSNIDCQVGDEVEIIGENQKMLDLAKKMQTIPYEVMTGINKRVSRVYIR